MQYEPASSCLQSALAGVAFFRRTRDWASSQRVPNRLSTELGNPAYIGLYSPTLAMGASRISLAISERREYWRPPAFPARAEDYGRADNARNAAALCWTGSLEVRSEILEETLNFKCL